MVLNDEKYIEIDCRYQLGTIGGDRNIVFDPYSRLVLFAMPLLLHL
jgi:hypothetical protein